MTDPSAMIGSIRMAKSKVVICPYCGETQPAGESCRACGGLFEPLSRQATHNAMGPWFIRDPQRPFQPGASYATLVRMIERGQMTRLSIVRGPTTKQFWTVAKRVPGIAHLLGYCHACDARVDPGDHGCHECGARFGAYLDRNYLGLPEIQPLPWEEGLGEEAPETSALSTTPPAATPGFEPAEAMPPQSSRGGRISSFATDEELLGPAGQGERAWTGAPTEPASTTPTPPAGTAGAESAAEQAAKPAAEPAGAAPAPTAVTHPPRVDDTELRAARRRTRRLQQTVGRLWIALLAVLVINVVLLAVLALGRGPDATPMQSDRPAAPQNGTATPPTDAAEDEPAADTAPPEAQTDEPDASRDEAAQTEQTKASSSDAPPPQGDGFATALADAEALIEAAQDDQRPLADRIADYQAAIELLRNVQANAPDDVKPDDLDQRIEQAERELERLRLREFFP